MVRAGVLVLTARLLFSSVDAYVSVPFQTARYYGFDGPWQAVQVEIGRYMSGQTPQSQYTAVDLLPGGGPANFVPTFEYCQVYGSSGGCAVGGSFNPYPSDTMRNETQAGKTLAVATFNYFGRGGVYMNGSIFARDLNINTGNGSIIIPNAGTAGIEYGNITFPNGSGHAVNVGVLSVGGPYESSVYNATQGSIQVWTMQGYLYDRRIIKSQAYTIHIGSAALNYPGSLIFGGYDKGRAIGPGTVHMDKPPQLLDIVIGIETGSSPFPFDSMSGLLLDPDGIQKAGPATIELNTPFLLFPKQTCEALANVLPIKFDAKTGYYLWNETDPAFVKITTSPAYLGFVFPGAGQTAQDITIKVPFALLNLTLTPPATPAGSKQYFPCQPYSTNYILGRAFLQAAFYGTYWGKQSWLAQAPGPGVSNKGLGMLPQDIENGQTVLDYSDESFFGQSWAPFWTPLPGNTPPPPTSSSTSSLNTSVPAHSAPTEGLTKGAKVGIGVGTASGVLVIMAVIGMCIFYVHKRSQTASTQYHGPFSELGPTFSMYPDDAKPLDVCELASHPVISELPHQRDPYELEVNQGDAKNSVVPA